MQEAAQARKVAAPCAAGSGRRPRFPEPASEDLFGGTARNFQVFGPLAFLAELTQHIPNQGEQLVRYYGHYSNKARGCVPNATTTRPTRTTRPSMMIQTSRSSPILDGG